MTNAIDYAPRQHWLKRKRLRRAVIWLFILAALAVAAWQFGPRIYQRCLLLYWQRQCLNYANPPGPATKIPPKELISYIDSLPPGSRWHVLQSSGLYSTNFHSMYALERNSLQRICFVNTTPGNTFYLMDLVEPATFSHDPVIIGWQRFCDSKQKILNPDPLILDGIDYARVDPADKSCLLIPVDNPAATKIPGTKSLQARFRLSADGNTFDVTLEALP